ncbi:MAG: B12-binding domain-containing radical SAM protein [Nitrospinae bacterium]|nr:B12-binding domain-containing radical SAM protein [Nitrospinota bacterium]MBF0635214.1 B12-binding domain-containing radical SAM protein [Nitrospinota bacterium]
MKVLLFYPNFYGMNMLPPAMGLFTAILRGHGHEVAMFDTTYYEKIEGFDVTDFDKMKSDNLNARPFDDSILQASRKSGDCVSDMKNLLAAFKPDLIAMSCTEDMYPLGVAILKQLDNKPPVVAGGIFPTSSPQMALEYSQGAINYIITGEGERALPEFCARLEQGKDLRGVPGLWMYRDGKLTGSPLPALVDVNDVPLPEYDLYQESRFYRPMQGKLRRMFPIETHRGCPYTCAFCNSPTTADNYHKENMRFFRKKKISNVRKELRLCVDKYHADSFYFWADTFLAWSEEEFDEFCEMYKEFRRPFWIQTRPETITEYRLKRLKEVGLLRIAFGLEHGNEEFRATMLHRKVRNAVIIEKLNLVYSHGIPFSVNNIMGFPQETRELVFDTIELNRKIKSDGINAYTYTPFHGTPLRKISEDLGFVRPEDLSRCIGMPSVLKMPQFTPEQIEGLRRCFVLYVKMPKSRWDDIKKAEALTPEGDRIWTELKKECFANYMQYGDYDDSDDIDPVES